MDDLRSAARVLWDRWLTITHLALSVLAMASASDHDLPLPVAEWQTGD